MTSRIDTHSGEKYAGVHQGRDIKEYFFISLTRVHLRAERALEAEPNVAKGKIAYIYCIRRVEPSSHIDR